MSIAQYLHEHVYCRCGQAVSLLSEAGVLPRPQMPSSELEIAEWWLVSAELAEKLAAVQAPLLRLGELNMWGRTSTSPSLKDDLVLMGAVSGQA